MDMYTWPVESHSFAFNGDEAWFVLRPYNPYKADQGWLASRVDLWSAAEGPIATLSVNLDEQLTRPAWTFYTNPNEYMVPVLAQLEAEGWIAPFTVPNPDTGVEEDFFPRRQVGLHPKPARLYMLTRQALALFEQVPSKWIDKRVPL